MKYVGRFSRAKKILMLGLVALIGVCGVVPWWAVAREEQADADNPPRASARLSNAERSSPLPDGANLQGRATQLPQGVDDARESHHLRCVAFSVDASILAGGSADGTITLWNAATGDAVLILEVDRGPIHSIAFSPDGETLASGSDTVKLWNVRAGKVKHTLSDNARWISPLVFSSDGSTLACMDGIEGQRRLRVRDAQTGKLKRTVKLDRLTYGLAMSPDGNTLVTGSKKGVILLDAHSGELKWKLADQARRARVVAFSPDGKTVACGTDRREVLLDAEFGKLKQELMGHTGRVCAVAFSRDGQLLVTGGAGPTYYGSLAAFGGGLGKGVVSELKFWDVDSGRLLETSVGGAGKITSIAFSTDGSMLAKCDSGEVLVLSRTRGGQWAPRWTKWID